MAFEADREHEAADQGRSAGSLACGSALAAAFRKLQVGGEHLAALMREESGLRAGSLPPPRAPPAD